MWCTHTHTRIHTDADLNVCSVALVPGCDMMCSRTVGEMSVCVCVCVCARAQVIILIGNKADLEAQRDVTYEEAKQFAEENGENYCCIVGWIVMLTLLILHYGMDFDSDFYFLLQGCCSWRPAPKREYTHTHYFMLHLGGTCGTLGFRTV